MLRMSLLNEQPKLQRFIEIYSRLIIKRRGTIKCLDALSLLILTLLIL
jgi:hypothetical protein